MAPEKCKNGHVRTEENTSWVKRGDRPGMRRRCLDCKRPGRKPLKEHVAEKLTARSVQLTTYRHEDVEDLISYGATFNEIIERSGFHDWSTLLRSLKRRERYDLIDAIRLKRESSRMSSITSSGTYGGKTTKGRHNRTKILPGTEKEKV